MASLGKRLTTVGPPASPPPPQFLIDGVSWSPNGIPHFELKYLEAFDGWLIRNNRINSDIFITCDTNPKGNYLKNWDIVGVVNGPA